MRYPWHEANWRLLTQARTVGRLPHALLLSGPVGLGKRAFAESFAKSLLCAQPGAEGVACGTCRSCRFFGAGTHPDFHMLEPEESGKPIRVDAVREFTSWSVMSAQEGQSRVTVIVPADGMNAAAANSLLKTLEEPVAGNHILLVSARPSALPATVRSRCQTLAFAPPPPDRAIAWLQEQEKRDDWGVLLRLAGKAPLLALELARADALTLRAARFSELEALLDARGDPIDLAGTWVEDPQRNLDWLASWIRDLARLHGGAPGESLENPDLARSLQRMTERIDWSESCRALERIDRASQVWPRANLNLRLQMEALLIGLAEGTS